MRVGTRRVLLARGSTAFTPLSLASLQWWHKADAGLTLATTGYAGSGTVTQVGTAITGIGTAFTNEAAVGDGLSGTLISGTVTVITDDTHLTVNASNSGVGASYTITPTAGVSDRVTTIADQSGNGYDWGQATQVRKMAKLPNVKNSLPALYKYNNDAGYNISTSPLTTSFSYFLVYKTPSDLGGTRRILIQSDDSAQFRTNNPGKMWFYNGAAGVNAGTTLAESTWYILGITYATPNVTFYLNGAADGTGSEASASAINFDRLFLLLSNPYFAEDILCNAVVSAGERANVFSYLNTKWAVY